MKSIEELTRTFKADQHPGQKLGEFLLDHSNAPEYLIGVLGAFLDAAREDRARAYAARLFPH